MIRHDLPHPPDHTVTKLGLAMNDERPPGCLDPEDWDSFRALAHRAVDEAIDHLASVRERPVWQPVPAAIVEEFRRPLPREPQPIEAAYEDFKRWVMPYPMGNTHPRFWGWYMGAGTASGALGDFLASMLNPNMGGGDHLLERAQVDAVVTIHRDLAQRARAEAEQLERFLRATVDFR